MRAMRAFLITSLLILIASPVLAGKPPVFSKRGVAVRGYDVVAYFTDGKPVKGSSEFATDWNGTTWHFASQDHLDRFKADPEKYAPQYGGYCAWAVAKGKTASTDPDAWKIVDGKLYLNYNANIQEKWEADIAALIEKGNANWPKVLD